MNIIETTDLNFSYGKQQVIKGLSIKVEQGAIYGLLGRNGNGKSTLMKLLLGLLPSKKGAIKYFGQPKFDYKIFYEIGCLIESPALYDFMTVKEHITMLNLLFKKGHDKIEQTIRTVGLYDEKDKIARKLSTGQRQRLGIALAIFRDPQILILDEPLNGLDSIGIIDIRNLLLKLNKEGTTIILSSHIISEIEKLCTHIGIIEQGRLLFEGQVELIPDSGLENFYLQIINNIE